MKNEQIDYRSGQPMAIENIHLIPFVQIGNLYIFIHGPFLAGV